MGARNCIRCPLGAAVLLAAALGGCKVGSWKKDKSADAAGASAVLPLKTADATGADGTPFDVDDKTGRPKPNLVLRLDFFPTAQPGNATLPACYRPFPPDFSLGFVDCSDHPGQRVALTARNVEQDCYTDPKVPRTPAAQPVVLAGCKKGMLLVNTFDPQLKVDVEMQN